jgi:hypothetical protein
MYWGTLLFFSSICLAWQEFQHGDVERCVWHLAATRYSYCSLPITRLRPFCETIGKRDNHLDGNIFFRILKSVQIGSMAFEAARILNLFPEQWNTYIIWVLKKHGTRWLTWLLELWLIAPQMSRYYDILQMIFSVHIWRVYPPTIFSMDIWIQCLWFSHIHHLILDTHHLLWQFRLSNAFYIYVSLAQGTLPAAQWTAESIDCGRWQSGGL